MITDVVFRSLRSRSRLIPVEELLNTCAGSRMPEIVPELLTVPMAYRLANACPTSAITTHSRVSGGLGLTLDYGKCIGCGNCVDAGEGTVRLAQHFAKSGVSREELVRVWQVYPEVEEDEQITPDIARDQFYNLLGRALNIRQLDPGSCNGCEAEITALTNPYYDLERFGIHFVASPKHADMLLVTGPITRNMAGAALKTYEAVPSPKLVVAVGACGCSGGIFAARAQDRRASVLGTANFEQKSNDEIVGGVDSLLPIDGYIPGCPPTPAMLITGILEVLKRCRQR
jgi:Ni,Fe-hydrogenase III small subunit/ferredoxin